MFKKILFGSLTILVISTSAQAIDIPSGEVSGFNKLSTAYSSSEFNTILEGYGLNLSTENVGDVPGPYAAVKGGEVVFNDAFKAYFPAKYHAIFTAYGLKLSPEKVSEVLKVSNYAKVKGGEVVFGDRMLALNGSEWENVLAAYELAGSGQAPMKMMPVDSDGDGVVNAIDQCPDTPRGVIVDERGCWVLANKFLFDFDSAKIKSEFLPELDRVKNVFVDNPDLRVQIEGHTDSKGSEAYNQGLSERRANAVKDYLINNVGAAAGRLEAVGYGELKPAYTNTTAAGRAKNRRIEFSRIK